MAADEESFGRAAVPNPYTGPGPDLSQESQLFDKAKRLGYMGISHYFLMRLSFYSVLVSSPHIRHEWFKIGIAATIAILSIKAYVEMFEGLLRKKKVNYNNFKQTTHAAIFLVLAATFCFNVALWPHYGWNSPIVLGLCFFGVILQLLMIIPPWLSNIVAFVGLTFFLQEYQ